MLASSTGQPFDDDQWIFEIKWDGYRAVSVISTNGVSIYSRNEKELTGDFKEIVSALGKIRWECVLDGEIVYLDPDGKPDFYSLSDPQKRLSGRLVYYVFDILYLDGYDITSLPLSKRKELLVSVLDVQKDIRISEYLKKEGVSLFKAAAKEGLEGIIAKRFDSIYKPGKRTDTWLKIKNRHSEEFLIGGFKFSVKKPGSISSLLIGKYDNTGSNLIYYGKVGSGIEGQQMDEIKNSLLPIVNDKNPFDKEISEKDIRWVKPKIIVQVEYSEKTAEGLLRHPSFKGMRKDKSPQEVKKELKIKYKGPEDADLFKSRVKIKNPDKIFWPQKHYTKKDLIEYYVEVSDRIMPYIIERPQSLNRYPDGIKGKNFFQKDIDYKLPDWLQKKEITHSDGKHTGYLICNGLESLIYMVNLGCIEINPWLSRVGSLENPDFAIIDLDPSDISFEKVKAVAKSIKSILEKVKIDCFLKTSGAKGLHIYIPLGAKYRYSQVLDFTKILARIITSRMPGSTSIERNPGKRQNKVYIDMLQNRFGQTVVAPYSVRPVSAASVSTPLSWSELETPFKPSDFNIDTIRERLSKKGDLWEGIFEKTVDILESIANIRNYFSL